MNPQKIALVTDSCADLPKRLIKKYDIYVIPLRILFSDGEFHDGVNITATDIYKRQKTELPKTSLPDGDIVEKTFQKIRDMGYEKVICVHLSSGLSGTSNMIRLIGEQFVGIEVKVFDSKSASLGTGFAVMQLAKYIEQGRTWTELLRATPKLIANSTVFFCIDTLEYLQKGGRIGRISAVAGTLLQIKPILSFAATGELTSVAKVRGRKAALAQMVKMVADLQQAGVKYNIAVAHGDSPDELKELRTAMKQALPNYENLLEGEIDGTLAVYVGPHLMGAAIQILPEDLCD